MIPNIGHLDLISGNTSNRANKTSLIVALSNHGERAGLDLPHRLTQFLAQTGHESASFRYDEEIASGAAYEGRKDLGNTQPGDGKRYKGRGPIQLTGRANYRAFTDWAVKTFGKAPDFERDPELINTDPWEGLVAIWFWSEGNSTGKSLNRYADENNIEMITRRINGGLNGFPDRLRLYTRAALVLSSYDPGNLAAAQRSLKAAGLYTGAIDGEDGPKTRAALHLHLSHLSRPALVQHVTAAPVVEERRVEVPVEKEVEVPIVAKGADKRGWLFWPAGGIGLGSIVPAFFDLSFPAKIAIAGAVLALIVIMLFLGEMIIRRTKALIKEALS